jgi:signal peptidase II
VSRQRLIGRVNSTVVGWALTVVALDSVTKWWARHSWAHQGRHLVGPVWLRVTYNSGISFSLNHSLPLLTTVVALVFVVAVAAVALRAAGGLGAIGLGLLLGGGLSNELDRLVRSPHEVTDFIAVGWFPVFNVADAAVTVGLVIVIVELLRGAPLVRR